MLKHAQMRRDYEAACRDKNPGRFFRDFREALDKKEIDAEHLSIRALFEQFVEGGAEIAASWNPRNGGDGINLMEAGNAVDTAAFSNISGQIVYSAIMEAFTSEAFVFSPLVKTIPTQFNGEKIAGIARIGDKAEVVNEGGSYPNVGVSEDYIETPVTTKRGMIVPITKEAIFFDRTGMLLSRCAEVGEFLALNKEKRIIDCIIDENVTAHRNKWRGTVNATYQTSTPWDNVTAGATLVDWTDLDEAFQTLAAITDPNTGEPILNVPKDIIVTRQNEWIARMILNATEVHRVTPGFATSANPSQSRSANPVPQLNLYSSQLLAARMATDTTWYVGDIRKAFAYMENWPITVVQAPSNSEVEFTNDIVQRWKVSERGATTTLEPRVMTKCTVA